MKQKLSDFISHCIPGMKKPVLMIRFLLVAVLLSTIQINAAGAGDKKNSKFNDSNSAASVNLQQIAVSGTVKTKQGCNAWSKYPG